MSDQPGCTCRWKGEKVMPTEFFVHDLPCEYKLWVLYDSDSPLHKLMPLARRPQ